MKNIIQEPNVNNTSGKKCLDSELPPETKKLSWAGFFLGWIWGIFNRTYIALLTILPFGLPINILLLIMGKRWAWQNKKWESLYKFEQTQRRWNIWGIIIGVIGFFWNIILLIVFALFWVRLQN